MDDQTQFSPTLVESQPRRQLKVVVAVVALLIMCAVGAAAYYWYHSNQEVVVEEVEQTPPFSYGIAADIGTATGTPYGTMYYTTPSALYPINDTVSYSHQVNVATNESVLVTYQPARDFNPVGASEGVLLSPADETYDSQTWKPQYFNRASEEMVPLPSVDGHWFNDLAFAPDGKHYVYAFTEVRDPSPNLRSVADWSIAIHAMDTGESTIIPMAVEPVWLSGGADVIYLTTTGIVRYNLASGQATTLFSDYVPFDFNDDLAVSPDSKHVILTVPFLQGKTFISVFAFTNEDSVSGTLTEVSRIVSDDTKRRTPVFSPDGLFYAVVAAKETRADGSSNVPEIEKTIEIRALDGVEPVKTITLTESDPAPVELEAWTQ